jgi:hypothetical protein
MKRREFIKAGAMGTAATTLAAPAVAQDVRQWTMVTAWPKNLPGPGVAAQTLADRITTLSGGRLEVKLYAAGEIVPGPGVFDAVSEGTADLYHAVPAYWGSKSKGILLFGSQPFGLRADEQVGWMVHGGGQALYDEMYGRFNIKPFLCGNSGPQWFGWFREEITSPDDLKGMKYRTTGLASEMCSELGMAVQAMSGSAMFQAVDGLGARLPADRQDLLLAGDRRAQLGRGVRRQPRGLRGAARRPQERGADGVFQPLQRCLDRVRDQARPRAAPARGKRGRHASAPARERGRGNGQGRRDRDRRSARGR